MDFALSVIDVNRHTWHQCENLIKPIPHDIYFSPEYLTLFDGKDEAVTDRFGKNPKMIVYGNEDNYIVHPVLLKPINSLPFYQVQNRDDDTILYDLVSPWYYGGPLICLQEESTKKHLLDGFFSEFTGYCKEHNFISEFVRLHPLLKNYQAVGGYVNAESKSQIVYVDLMQDLDTIWNNYKQENRKAINRAQRRGVEIEISKRPEDIKTFFELYTKSMDRLNADKVYYFSMDFFNNLFSTLGEHAQLFSARYEGQIISSSLLIGMGNYAHDYLRAFDFDYSSLVPNNLVVHNKILWSKNNGYKIFSLQGGRSRDDGIFRFKLTFSKLVADFYTYHVIHNLEKYAEFCTERAKFDQQRGQLAEQHSDFFPYYRR